MPLAVRFQKSKRTLEKKVRNEVSDGWVQNLGWAECCLAEQSSWLHILVGAVVWQCELAFHHLIHQGLE